MTLGNLGNFLNLCASVTLSIELALRVPIHNIVKIKLVHILGADKTMCLVQCTKKVGETSVILVIEVGLRKSLQV